MNLYEYHTSDHNGDVAHCIVQVTVRVWSRPEAYSQTEFALQVAVSVISYYEKFFDTAYPLPKQGIYL